MVPPMVENPGMEPHIHSMKVLGAKDNKELGYLQTSPEFFLKKVLSLKSEELKNIFSLTYCFRDEPNSGLHRNQFIMLEWYRTGAHYSQIMKDTEELIKLCSQQFNNPINQIEKKTVNQIFNEILGFSILDYLDCEKLKAYIQKNFDDIHVPQQKLPWEDYFFLLFLNKIEPELKKYPAIFLYEFPAPLAALSTLKPEDTRVCERFEIYCYGIELANCYNELTDLEEQKARFEQQANLKKELYNYQLPSPNEFYQTLERGLPHSAGIALGIERLQMILTNSNDGFLF